jgi:hypothetical protein
LTLAEMTAGRAWQSQGNVKPHAKAANFYLAGALRFVRARPAQNASGNRVLRRSPRHGRLTRAATVLAGSGISAAWSEWLEGCMNTTRVRLIMPLVKRRQAARGSHWDLFRERVAKKTRIKVNRGKVA